MGSKQIITLNAGVTGGTFTLTGPNRTTTDSIAATSTPRSVQTCLSSIFGKGNVTVTGAAKYWVVEFADNLGVVPCLIGNGDNLVGLHKAVKVALLPSTLTDAKQQDVSNDSVAPTAIVQPSPESISTEAAPISAMALLTGSGVVGTAPKQLGDGVVHNNLVLRANGSNTGVICIGNSLANATEGYILGKGETTQPLCIDNLNKVFLVGSDKMQGYSWIAT